jgi:hypothetical protein
VKGQDLDFGVVAWFADVRAQGAKALIVEYSGSGDSGGVDAVRLTRAEPPDDDEMPSEGDGGWQATEFAADAGLAIPEQLQERIETWAYRQLPSGFENNEGGFGRIVLDLRTMTAKRTHYDRLEDAPSGETVGPLDLPPMPEAAVKAFREIARRYGAATATVNCYPDDGEIVVQDVDWPGFRWDDLGQRNLAQAAREAAAEWLDERLADLPLGEAGASVQVALDLAGEPPVASAMHAAYDYGAEGGTEALPDPGF